MTYEESISSIAKHLDNALMEAAALKQAQTGTQEISELTVLLNDISKANWTVITIEQMLALKEIMKERK